MTMDGQERPPSSNPPRRATAEAMATKQRDISVSEFFTKNRHLLGFDNPAKALLTTIKEAVDNALDACEEAGILPSLEVRVEELAEGRYRVRVEDNGPGIVKEQIPKIFAKLLYGSKFHRLRQSRGQQGIGISAAGMYGQLTTGKPVVVVSKIGKGRPAWRLEVRIDARTNNPEVLNKDQNTTVPWEKDHGTMVELELSGLYRGGRTSVDAYLEQTVVANPHLELTWHPPKGNPTHWPRACEELPPEAHEIKPHPHGVELGMLLKILHEAGARSVRQTLLEEFSRVTAPVAEDLCRRAGVSADTVAPKLSAEEIGALHAVMQASHAALPPPRRFAVKLAKSDGLLREDLQEDGAGFTPAIAERVLRAAGVEPTMKSRLVTPALLDRVYDALHASQVKILPPPATCVVPIGEALLLEGLKRRFRGGFFAAHTRPPAVYRGNPFVVEAGIAFGGELAKDEPAELLRFANRVPLLYQPRACGVTEAVLKVDWKAYGLQQRKGELPVGPLAVVVHLASVWVPYTSEAKEAVAHYDDIVREVRMALMECGRQLGTFVRAQESERWEAERRSLFEKYIMELSVSLSAITRVPEERILKDFTEALPRHVKLAAPAAAEPEGGAGSTPQVAQEMPGTAVMASEVTMVEAAPEPAEPAPEPAPEPSADEEPVQRELGFGSGSAFEDVTQRKTRRLLAREPSKQRASTAPLEASAAVRRTHGGRK
ncbi:MAG: DNA topoisomerase VI subunit B [Deltaproteobacteria bacterium]|nr:DNA topoisomerase VI subunit B [Deltaproteobacteria bacterium]